MPVLVVLAGPNGAGKSTVAPAVLQGTLGVEEFVNADVIARGLSAFNPERAAIEAGRIMLVRLRALARQRVDFAFETTLASRAFAPWIAGLIPTGYDFHLVYVWVSSPDLCIARVADRVRGGGHHVPDDVVRRRYAGGVRNLFELYLPLAETWHVYDNTNISQSQLVAEGHHRQTTMVYDQSSWSLIAGGHGDANRR